MSERIFKLNTLYTSTRPSSIFNLSQNLSPKRKFAYIFDRRHFGMIGSVTQRDPSLEWEWTQRAGFWGGAKTAWEGHKTSKGGAFLGHQGHDRPAGNAGASCAGSWLPRSVIPVLEIGNRHRLRMDLVGKWACSTDARFLVPCSCAAHSCKIDIQVDNYIFYLVMKPPRPILYIMLQ